jgi:Flp pilus assembly pilin Flp
MSAISTISLPQIVKSLFADEAGFIVSAELALIATITVIGLIVGLAEVQNAVVNELNDIGDAIGSLNQSFYFNGHSSVSQCKLKAIVFGSAFRDRTDAGDNNECMISCDRPIPEVPKFGNGNGGGFRGGF